MVGVGDGLADGFGEAVFVGFGVGLRVAVGRGDGVRPRGVVVGSGEGKAPVEMPICSATSTQFSSPS